MVKVRVAKITCIMIDPWPSFVLKMVETLASVTLCTENPANDVDSQPRMLVMYGTGTTKFSSCSV